MQPYPSDTDNSNLSVAQAIKILVLALIPLFLSYSTSNCQAHVLDIESNYFLKLSLRTSRLLYQLLQSIPPVLSPSSQTILNKAARMIVATQTAAYKAIYKSACLELGLLYSDFISLYFLHHLLPSSIHMANLF